FQLQKLKCPGPLIDVNGGELWNVKQILDQRRCRCSWQYMVRWQEYSLESDTWLPRSKI
ncbi:hypothetical protein BDW22DRAFT_1316384, partial [Trametopsis cervina]